MITGTLSNICNIFGSVHQNNKRKIYETLFPYQRTAFDICSWAWQKVRKSVWYLRGIYCTALLSSRNASKAGESLQILVVNCGTVSSVNKISASVYSINWYDCSRTGPDLETRGRRRKHVPLLFPRISTFRDSFPRKLYYRRNVTKASHDSSLRQDIPKFLLVSPTHQDYGIVDDRNLKL